MGDTKTTAPKQENRFTIVLPPELREQVKELARQTQRTEGAMARRLITKGLEAYQDGTWRGE